MVEASRRHDRWSWRRMHSAAAGPTGMTDVLTTTPNETELEEAGSRRLLAAVDELSERTSHLKRRREQLWASLARVEQEPSRDVPPEQRRADGCPNRHDLPGSAQDGSVERGRGSRPTKRCERLSARFANWTKSSERTDEGHRVPACSRFVLAEHPRQLASSRRVVPTRRFDRRARAGCIATAAAAPRRPSTFCAKALSGRAFRRSACPPPKL